MEFTEGLDLEIKEEGKPSLKRQLGWIKATSYISGGIIGVGIFIGPGAVLKGVGSSVGVSLTIWVLCGLLGYCGALCYAEFGTRMPKSGGTYTYIKEAYGDLAGFLFLWSQLFLVRPLSTLLGCLAAAEYIVSPFFYTCFDAAPNNAKLLLGFFILVTTIAINCYSVNFGANIQTWATFCKISALLVITISGIAYLIQGNTENFSDAWATNTEISITSVVLSVYVCGYAYIGWDNITVATEEITNPKRNIPLSILLGFTIATVVYLSANVAYHAVLTNNEIMSGVAVAVVFGERLLGEAKWLIPPCVGISAAGIVNTIVFTSSRINFVGGRDGLIPEFFSMVNIKRRTPIPSIIVLGGVTMVYLCFVDLLTGIGANSFFRAAGEVLAISGIFRLRRLHPASNNTFVSPTIIPLIYLVVSMCTMCVAIVTNPRTFLPGIVLILLGIPVYYVVKTSWWKKGPAIKIQENITIAFQRLFLSDIATKIINKE